MASFLPLNQHQTPLVYQYHHHNYRKEYDEHHILSRKMIGDIQNVIQYLVRELKKK